MQSTTHGTSRDQGRMGRPVSNSTSDDDSGLHDLKALASSTKQRRSQRMSSQMEAQDSLLQSAAGLGAVALPDPNKEQPMSLAAVAIVDGPLATATESETALSAPLKPSIGSSPTSTSNKLLILSGLAFVVAGAVAFYMMRATGTETGETATTAANAVVVPLAEKETAIIEAPAPMELAMDPALAAGDESAEEAKGDDAAEVLAAKETTDEPTKEEAVMAEAIDSKASKSEKGSKVEKSASSDIAIAKAEARAAKKAETKAARELAKVDKAAAKNAAAKSNEKAPTLGEGGASLDDVLSSVTGGVDKPIAEQKDDKPTKKKLERGDVAKAMKGISPAAKKCYAAEEFTGTVMVKYSIAPNGSMTKAKAMGAHKSSKTGKCVLSAVKKAKFPAFSGATQSFTFPFLLSP